MTYLTQKPYAKTPNTTTIQAMPHSYHTIKHRNPDDYWVVTEFLFRDRNQPNSLTISVQLSIQEHNALKQGLSRAADEILEQLLLDGFQGSYQAAYVAAIHLCADPLAAD